VSDYYGCFAAAGLKLWNSFLWGTGFIFYRAMHFSAKRGIAIACRLSVCDVGEL